MKVLVVDDNDGVRYAKARLLRQAGYTVLEAASGADTLHLIDAEHPDLVLLDVKLPDLNGFEVCKRLKHNPATADIIVIQMSASFVDRHDKVRGLEGGADAYLTEPVQPEELVATVQALLRLRQVDLELRQTRDALEERVHERTAELERAIQVLRREITRRRQSEKALLTSQQFLKSTLDALSSHIAILDEMGRILDLNASWQSFATTRDSRFLSQSRGMHFSDFFLRLAANPDAALIQAIITGVHTVVTAQQDVFFSEYGHVTDSETQYFFVRASCFNAGEDTRTIVVLENITEVKRAEEVLRRQQEALYESEKLAAMGALLASVAHELNNPLAAMQMQLDLLAEEMPEQITQERLSEAREATARCIRIVQSFLTLARRRTPQRTPVEINAVVENAVQFLSHALQLDNVTVEQQLAENLPIIGADAVELQQVLVNLLLNAQQAIQGSTAPLALRQVKLTTQLDTAQNRIILEVADTGPGIPARLQEHIFEPFVTSKPVGVGTGLGLSVCRGIIEGHGGTIRVVERRGYGAVFRVELPVEPAPITESAATEGPLVPAPVGAVLIVDDEVGLVRALARLLGRDGHTVDIATNGYQALTMLQTQEYDLILCDLRMPELDGPGLYRAVGVRYPHLLSRFIFLTGDTLGKDARDFLEHAGVPHLVKPFSASEGRRLVQQALTASA